MEIMKGSGAYCNLQSLLLLLPQPQLPASSSCLHFSTKHCNYLFAHTQQLHLPSSSTKIKWKKSVTSTNALLDDSASAASIATTEVPPVDLALQVKKKAAEIGPELKGTSIFLVGLNTSLKSSLGKLIADGLRYYYFDSDALVEEAVGGKLAAKSLLQTDDKAFRDSETEVLKQLSSMGRLVVSAGNGAVQCAANLALLRHGISIWIDVPLDMVAREVVDDRIQLPASEMSISGSYSEVLNQLTALYEDRHNGYATADTTISLLKVASELGYDDLDTVTTEDMALEVLRALERLVRVKKMMAEASRPF